MQKNYRPSGVGTLPAQTGTYLVHAYIDDHQVDLVRSNVIGWQVGADRTITPLVIDPRALDEDPWHVTHPDGRVECSNGNTWPDIESWIDETRRNRRDAA